MNRDEDPLFLTSKVEEWLMMTFVLENCLLDPFLFSIFLNDLESYLRSKDVSGLTTLSEEIENQLNVYLKLFVILYADDTVIMSKPKRIFKNNLMSFPNIVSFGNLKLMSKKLKFWFFLE